MMRIGFGYDVHRLVSGRPLLLGGIYIPYDKGLDGHSDADVLLHAISDALLGAAALGDIGHHFPDTDPDFKDADSGVLFESVVASLREAGYQVGNIDATVAAQLPKLHPHILSMRARIAALAGISVKDVSVKATTTEKMGFVGTGEGMSAYAVCTIYAV